MAACVNRLSNAARALINCINHLLASIKLSKLQSKAVAKHEGYWYERLITET